MKTSKGFLTRLHTRRHVGIFWRFVWCSSICDS